jgi:hypothetical protein
MSWRSKEMVPEIQDMTMQSRRRHAGFASTGRSVGEDVAVEGVATKNEKLVPPSSVGGGVGVEDDSDQGLDVRVPGDLKVEVGNHGVVRATRGSNT